ncbi:MAG: methyltransferase domain-containing protein [Acidimicrobiales bacterium]
MGRPATCASPTLALVQRFSSPSDPVIDIGGGDSRMVDELTEAGYSDLTVLDVSDSALTRARSRLGSAGRSVSWVRADVTRWEPARTWALWHDRAVFHFLAEEEDRRAYVDIARWAVAPGGHLVVATFALDGPDQCAGLPVERYDAEGLASAFGASFRFVEHTTEHRQDAGVGDSRPYVAVVMQRQ